MPTDFFGLCISLMLKWCLLIFSYCEIPISRPSYFCRVELKWSKPWCDYYNQINWDNSHWYFVILVKSLQTGTRKALTDSKGLEIIIYEKIQIKTLYRVLSIHDTFKEHTNIFKKIFNDFLATITSKFPMTSSEASNANTYKSLNAYINTF